MRVGVGQVNQRQCLHRVEPQPIFIQSLRVEARKEASTSRRAASPLSVSCCWRDHSKETYLGANRVNIEGYG